METTSATSSEPQGMASDIMDLSDESPGASTSGDPNILEKLIKVQRTKTVTLTRQMKEVQEAYRDEHGAEVEHDLLVEEEKIKRICCIPVKEGVRCWNVLAIPLVPCTIMLLSTYVNAQTIFLLRDPEFFDVPENRLGRISSQIVLAGFPVAMFGTFFAGYLFDILGRRVTLFMAFFTASIFLFVIPYTSPSVFPGLLFVRVGFTLFSAMPSSNPLLADYIHKDAIGKAAAFIGLGFVIGEVLSMGILFNVTKNMSAYDSFLTAAGSGAFCSLGFLLLVKEPQLREREIIESPKSIDAEVSKKTIFDSPANTPDNLSVNRDISAGFDHDPVANGPYDV